MHYRLHLTFLRWYRQSPLGRIKFILCPSILRTPIRSILCFFLSAATDD